MVMLQYLLCDVMLQMVKVMYRMKEVLMYVMVGFAAEALNW